MKLWYFHDAIGNFGDDLNPWLWDRLLPGYFDGRPDKLFLGIGTIIRAEVPREPLKLVFGAGTGYGNLPELDDRWRFYCVRGPLTAARLGLPADSAVTDAAALVAAVRPPSTRTGGPMAFMPHHTSALRFDWRRLCRRLGITYLDPAAPVPELLEAISGSRAVIAEAMHGAIVADALRVPWIPVVIYDHINEFKWDDWCRSLELTYAPQPIEPITDNASHRPLRRFRRYLHRVRRTRSLVRAGRGPRAAESGADAVERTAAHLAALGPGDALLSDDGVLAERVAALRERLARLRTDHPR